MNKTGKNNIKNIAFVIAGLIIVIVIIGGIFASKGKSDSKEKTVVRFGSSAGENGILLGLPGVARELGYIQEELNAIGYDVEFAGFANGVAVNEAFASNNLDVSTLGDVPCSVGLSNDIGITWIGVGLSTYNNTIVVTKDSGIREVKDLEGKSVAYGIGTASQHLFEKVVIEYGLDENKINVNNLSGSNGVNAVLTGDVDAAVIGENQAQVLAADKDADILLSTADYPEWAPQDTFVGRTEFLKENPDVAVAIQKAFIRAKEAVIENPDKYYVTLSAKQIETHPELGKSIYYIDNGAFDYLDSKVEQGNIDRLQLLADFLYEIDKITTKVDISQNVDNSYYEKAKEELDSK